ncbi:hypothetical protein [Brevibacillus brevis]|uniref:hypothetical protein n=1 Tax=Brevibacillus brevis TaxID=1393 RepID=UPI0007D89DF0|nr:hypothetical protein [Brevibacillus brevis]
MIKKLGVAIALFLSILSASSNTQACGEYVAFIYKVTKVENGQYWGTGIYDDSNVYFTQGNVVTTERFQDGDVVVAYFKPDNVEDGLVGVERSFLVGEEGKR